MANVEQLRDEHDRLELLVARLTAMIGRAMPPATAQLAAVRRELTTTLIAHLKREDWLLYPTLLDDPNPAVVATALRFSKELGGFSATFLDYAGKWHATAIESDWAGFCEETATILDALTRRIARENHELYPLLKRADRAA